MSALRDAIEREVARRVATETAALRLARNRAAARARWHRREARKLRMARRLPHFDMADPQIVEKLLATTKGTK